MSVRGIGWYGAAFVALLVSIAFIGVGVLSFFTSLTPFYVSIVCSVVAVVLGVVAAIRVRPVRDGAPAVVAAEEEERTPSAEEVTEPAEAVAPAEVTQPGDTE